MEFPRTLKTFTIRNCSKVHLDSQKLAEIALNKLKIQFVGELEVVPGVLKRVDQLDLEHIDHLQVDGDSFSELDAKFVTFSSVSFTSGSKITPLAVKTHLKFEHSELSDGMSIRAKQTDEINQLTVTFDGCRMSSLSLDVDVANFEMMGNQFVEISDPGSLVIRYSDSLTLEKNNYQNLLLPDVHCRVGESRIKFPPVTSADMAVSVEDGQHWWQSFVFTRNAERAVISSTTPRGRTVPTPQKTGECIELKALDEFFNVHLTSTTSRPGFGHQTTPKRNLPTDRPSNANRPGLFGLLIIISFLSKIV